MHNAELPPPGHLPDPADEPLDAVALQQPLSRRERAAVLARIQALMEFWGITLEDLLADPPVVEPPVSPGPRPVKYRHPITGETWDGSGPHPGWLRRALLKEGLRVDELRPLPASPPASEADR